MLKRINAAVKWRMRVAGDIYRKHAWDWKRSFDKAKREPVDSVSVVVTGRNDNYGGDFSKRLQTTMDWNLKNLPNPELIYVEWNRIDERDSDCLWIAERYDNVKCFTIPKTLHDEICDNPKLKLLEYHAKNVGIRRVENDWILLVNADCFVGLDVVKNLKTGLSKERVYGTHYTNIDWDGQSIEQRHLKDKSIRLHQYSESFRMDSTMGNFLLFNKRNFGITTGYDERLTDVRDGVDANGYQQIIHHGFKPIVLGTHYHLDHEGSRIYGVNDTHGNVNSEKLQRNIPYKNPDNWGLMDHPVKQLKDKIWEIQPKP